jgi:acetyl esterase
MPIGPAVEAVLSRLAPAGAPRAWQLTLEARRQLMRDQSLQVGGPRAPVDSIRDLRLGGVPVRLYRPAGEGPQPALVYLHGGGWTLGGIETHDSLCSRIAHQSGWTVISVGYRLAPEHKFPVPVFDCWAALHAVHAGAVTLGIDASRIAVGGDSAGGNLSAVMSLLARDYGLPLAGQVLIYPVTDYVSDRDSYRFDYLLSRADMELFWSLYLNHGSEAGLPLAAPIRAESLRGLPPCLLLTAEYDPLRDEGEEYADRLAAADVPVTAKRYRGMIHGFVNMLAVVPQSRDAVLQTATFLRHLDPCNPTEQKLGPG